MNAQMAYLLGMVLGNGEIQRGSSVTTVTIEIPHKNLMDDEGREVEIYVKASITDIRNIVEPLLGTNLPVTQYGRATTISFTKPNTDYAMREIMKFIGHGSKHSFMIMNKNLFSISVDEKKELLRGMADVTGYIRKSNVAFGNKEHHRVYIEIPSNWNMTIDVANMLKDLDIPVQTIDFGHPNFRDSNVNKYKSGKPNYWKKEHQIKIWANEFLPVGFNIEHKQRALEKYAQEVINSKGEESTHKFYWERGTRRRSKPIHPAENDPSLPSAIRGKHYESWTDLARDLGYHE